MDTKILDGGWANDVRRTLIVGRTRGNGWMVLYGGEYMIHRWVGTPKWVAGEEEEAVEAVEGSLRWCCDGMYSFRLRVEMKIQDCRRMNCQWKQMAGAYVKGEA